MNEHPELRRKRRGRPIRESVVGPMLGPAVPLIPKRKFGGPQAGSGRPPIYDSGPLMVHTTLRMTPEQRERFVSLGSSVWLRGLMEQSLELGPLLPEEVERLAARPSTPRPMHVEPTQAVPWSEHEPV